MDWKIEHPKGFFQPGVLALTREGRVLYRWRAVPSRENLNGTAARPTPAHVWEHIEKSLAAGSTADDAPHDDNPEIDRPPPPRLLFFAAVIANGWFLRAKSFLYSPGVESVPTRFKAAFSRWLLFVLVWVLALVFAPTPLVGLAFSGWLVWIGLDLRRVQSDMDTQVELTADRRMDSGR